MSVLLKTLLFTLFAPGSVLVLAPWLLLRSSWGAVRADLGPASWLGLVPLVAGVLAYLRCALDFAWVGEGTPAPLDPPRKLVAVGLYRWVRNPMYVAVGIALLGETMLFGAPVLLLWLGGLWAAFHLFVVLYEEPALRRAFGASYEAYVERVPRWFPRPPRPET